MIIIIELPDYPPAIYAPTWTSLQGLIRTCYVEERDVKLTRVSRQDNGVNYRAPGKYEFELDYRFRGSIEVDLAYVPEKS